MRIIRTETYIDSDTRHVAWGFGAAWVTKPGHIPVPPAPWEFFDEIGPRMARGRPRWRPVGTVAPQTMQRFLPAFVAISLRDLPRPRSIEGYFNIDTSRDAAVEFVLIQPIVIERSPPEWVELLSFLKGASPALLLSAYFVGVRKTSLLVLAKIGAGYILLASAVGLSRWLEDGQFISLLDQFFHR